MTVKVAPHGTPPEPLRAGECQLPTPDFVDAPIVKLWRFLDTEGSAQRPHLGLGSLFVAPSRGVIEVGTGDPVFQAFAFRASNSRLISGTLRVQDGGGAEREIEPGEQFRLRVTRMPCERNCEGYRPPSWEFYVVDAPLR